MPTTKNDEYKQLTSVPMVLCYLWRTEGAEAVEQALALSKNLLVREDLIEAGKIFRRLNLLELTALVQRHARKLKPRPSPDERKRWLLRGANRLAERHRMLTGC